MGALGWPELVTGLFQTLINANAPYNAAKAQLWATKEFLNNEREMNAVHSANQPSLASPFYTMDQQGNRVWHTGAMSTPGQRSYYNAHPKELTQVLANQTRDMKSKVDNPEPSLGDKLF